MDSVQRQDGVSNDLDDFGVLHLLAVLGLQTGNVGIEAVQNRFGILDHGLGPELGGDGFLGIERSGGEGLAGSPASGSARRPTPGAGGG